jgi:hypothetical protein
MNARMQIRPRSMATAAGLIALACMPLRAQTAPVVLDRVVAVVNNQAILSSDIQDEMRLSALEPSGSGEGAPTPQNALQDLISRDLIRQQIRQEDVQAAEPTQAQVMARLAELQRELPECVRLHCSTKAGWKAFLDQHDLTQARVERYLRMRLEVLAFIEDRFRQGIRIPDEDIEKYYRETLLPQYSAAETAPPLKSVAPRIEEILLQQQVNLLFGSWLDNLRKQGDVEVLDPALKSQGGDASGNGGSE